MMILRRARCSSYRSAHVTGGRTCTSHRRTGTGASGTCTRCREKLWTSGGGEHHNKRGGGPSANGKLARFGILFAVNGSRCFRNGHETFTSHGSAAAASSRTSLYSVYMYTTMMRPCAHTDLHLYVLLCVCIYTLMCVHTIARVCERHSALMDFMDCTKREG